MYDPALDAASAQTLSLLGELRDTEVLERSSLYRTAPMGYADQPDFINAVALVETELAGMRDRIRAMRTGLVDAIKAQGVAQDFSFVVQQRGMFSYTGLSAAQVERMKEEFGIYAVSTGRICLAALNSKNVDYVAKAIAAVTKG